MAGAHGCHSASVSPPEVHTPGFTPRQVSRRTSDIMVSGALERRVWLRSGEVRRTCCSWVFTPKHESSKRQSIKRQQDEHIDGGYWQ